MMFFPQFVKNERKKRQVGGEMERERKKEKVIILCFHYLLPKIEKKISLLKMANSI